MPTFYLIDGNSYIYRAFYAIRGLSASDGTPTNAIFGFTNMIMKIIREKSPDYFGIVFDSPGPTHRHEAFEGYKAHRPGMPEELKVQVPAIKEIVKAFHIRSLELPGYEADDLLGAIAKKAERERLEVFIVTGDKDLCQVVGPAIKLYDSMKEKITEEKDVVARYGVKPARFPEVIALMGDASDNIPGAPGIGEKTAIKLLQEFGDIEQIIQNHEKIKNARARNAVSDNIDNIRLSRELATIHTDIQLDLEIADFKCGAPDWERLLEYFRTFEFSSLVKLVPSRETGAGRNTESEYITVLDRKTLDRAISEIREEVTVDTETSSASPMDAELAGISFASSKERAYYVPVGHVYPGAPDQLEKEYVLDQLKGVLKNSGILKTGHNIKYDFIVLAREGLRMEGVGFDSMIASYLLNPNRSTHNLDDTALEHLGIKKISFNDVMGKDRKDFREVPVEEATVYSGEDSAVTFRLKEKFGPELERSSLSALFHEIEMPLVEVLADMEMAGVKIDVSLMDTFSKKMANELSGIEQRIYFMAGEEFNINSPKQLQEILYEKLGLKPTKKTKTGYSTNMEVLEQLSRVHELPKEIIEYRGLSKLKNTYVDALPKMVHAATGRVHTSFNQTVTATGRLSSSEPNLQNIPVRGEWGGRIREAFVAEEGNVLLSSDYSQIELRIFAHLSGDRGLIEAFNSDGDIHTRTACELFGVSADGVTPDMRRSAKTVNFGIVYGISPYGLSQQLGIGADEARHYIDMYFARHSGVKNYIDGLIASARESGFVATLYGRKRAVPELKSSNRNIRMLGERLATNSPVQGSAADIIKVAMIHIWKRMKRENLRARMVLQVHDELLFEVPEQEKDHMLTLVREEMEGAARLDVPLKVEIGAGKNWAEAH